MSVGQRIDQSSASREAKEPGDSRLSRRGAAAEPQLLLLGYNSATKCPCAAAQREASPEQRYRVSRNRAALQRHMRLYLKKAFVFGSSSPMTDSENIVLRAKTPASLFLIFVKKDNYF
ncbi:hypothetical protein DUI87_13032 [Hirundo rustica rustica]|uniref:Uncharacterized protein n=1 Tax=Hirundo rustica rustica TaxID=333673 RepID=A0A3M0KH11_HIRRU|nr:hypothetical protein DUI87_13032 [Hirundo rustica rustica]